VKSFHRYFKKIGKTKVSKSETSFNNQLQIKNLSFCFYDQLVEFWISLKGSAFLRLDQETLSRSALENCMGSRSLTLAKR
jgi:hypothetical protein